MTQLHELRSRITERAKDTPWLLECWDDASDLLRQALPVRTETDDDRYTTHGTDHWKWALYRLHFAYHNNPDNPAAVELDPFEDIVRLIFFHAEVESRKQLFEDLARLIPHSTWDHRTDPPGPVLSPRRAGLPHCPEIKFAFSSPGQWLRYRPLLEHAAQEVAASLSRR